MRAGITAAGASSINQCPEPFDPHAVHVGCHSLACSMDKFSAYSRWQ